VLTAPPAPREPAATDSVAQQRSTPRNRRIRTIIEWVVLLVIAVVVALLVRTYVVQTYYIPSGSMEPTLQVGDRILVVKAAYRFTSPAIGDVIVFKAPAAEASQCDSPSVPDLVKRIIATPGDTISSKGNTIYVMGHALVQDWQHVEPLGTPIELRVIPPNHYFVMGDNHPDSCDSRVWGTVPRSDIIGKAVLIFWPPSRWGTI
jgi:signal peptidase I